MRTNTFPDYHSQPLRLTLTEIANPTSVIFEFFQAYHLPEIRFCLHNMLQDSMHKETLDSKEHYSTYIEVEKLVEACWLIKESLREKKVQISDTLLHPIPTEILGKKVPWIELAKQDPRLVIKEIFKHNSLSELRNLITYWQCFALTTDCTIYDETNQRKQLLLFNRGLNLFTEALCIINSKNNNEEINIDELKHLSKNQIAEPIQAIEEFFDKFPIVYIRRELYDWLEASLSFVGPWPDDFHQGNILNAYNIFLCLVESAIMLASVVN
jgi:hypothetical protein